MRGLALAIVVALLELTNLIAVPVAIGNRWPAEFGAKSDPNRMAADWAGTLLSGTAISAPQAPLIVLAVAAVLALLPWRWPALIGGIACCLLGVLFTIGILGSPALFIRGLRSRPSSTCWLWCSSWR